jgi:hypothetical protein
MHSWKQGDYVLHHNNCTRPGNPVIITRNEPVMTGDGYVPERVEEMEVPFEVLLGFVCEMLQRDARAHQDDISAEDWLREQVGAPKR